MICFRIKKYQIQNNIILLSEKNKTLLTEDKWSDKSTRTKVKTKIFTTPYILKVTPKVGIFFIVIVEKITTILFIYQKTEIES